MFLNKRKYDEVESGFLEKQKDNNNTFANYVETEGSKAGWIMPKRAIC